MDLSARIRQKAVEDGFHFVGIAPATPPAHAKAFVQWLDNGLHAGMDWMGKNREKRSDPSLVLPGVRSIIVVGLAYYLADPPSEVWEDPLRGRIARYAWGRDYHDVMTPLLHQLADFVRSHAPTGTTTRVYVDTGPVLEKEVAAKAGLGFIGKNSLLIHPNYGSYLLLGEILTNLDLAHDQPTDQGGCGACRRCQEICPTHALPAPYVLDSRRCISYLTIEHKGSIPLSMRPRMGNWIFGCDACQSICPWVRQYAEPKKISFLRLDLAWVAPDLLELLSLTDQVFRKRYRGTPIFRTKRNRFVRNVAIALGNSKQPSALPALHKALNDPDPLVYEHVAWAIKELEQTCS